MSEPAPATAVGDLIVATEIDVVRLNVASARKRGERIGFVPTMGALHAGHVSLIERAQAESDYVVVSIFVNPTQFGPNEDFTKYPRTLDADLEACRQAGADLVFCPTKDIMYPPGSSTVVDVESLASVLEGKHRPGHFRGVATVVLKLFNIVQPDAAFFGQKDYQQLLVIRQMCRDLDVPVTIVPCPTVREAGGLAMSSRNRYLSPDERQTSLALSRALTRARERLLDGEIDVEAVRRDMHHELAATPGVVLDYATIADAETLQELTARTRRMVALIAARVGSTRLIDNMLIE